MNSLEKEDSLYLLQHAKNPVNWLPWGENAIRFAQNNHKPILLSIGYSACHWCHVMADESFSDIETASIMNQRYVNIKVDREERPDLDKLYQHCHQLLMGSPGGWPLTVFLDARDLTPFFGGTYFPPEPKFGLPAFKEILIQLSDYYAEHTEEISHQSQELHQALQRLAPEKASKAPLNTSLIERAFVEIKSEFDFVHGGIGNAPKFPQAPVLEFLLHYGWHDCQKKASANAAIQMVLQTLNQMAQGGIYDQLQGGFFRYSVDAEWRIPHFEKMLYDNAQLIYCYATAYQIEPNPLFKAVIEKTINWLVSNMRSSEGGFYSALDADTDHQEGKYYCFDKEEVQQCLTKEEYQLVAAYYGLNHQPNFHDHWHLYIDQSVEKCASKLKLSEDAIKKMLVSIQHKLMQLRKKRTQPACDKKILTSWNALLVKALIKAAKALDCQEYSKIGRELMDFIYNNLYKNGRLFSCYQNGKTKFLGYLDDYAFTLDALTYLIQSDHQERDTEFASQLADVMLAHFQDEQGGFFFTSNEHEFVMHRLKSFADEAIPAGGAIAPIALAKLGYLAEKQDYLHARDKTLMIASSLLVKHPTAYPSLMNCLKSVLDAKGEDTLF
ncbi:MAG: Thioredoxin-related protein [Gammaproteobacteria bacterium]|jgi:uncharacterized protein YyaL (SSP411 family)|nr:Thioredoxin-related protein [Gammaproteobacteria bacterium]